jgi:hypothetical protein
MQRFCVSRAVIDALPETRLSREFARRHGGKVFCCFYSEHQKGAYGWNEREFTVTANRTESMDGIQNEISNGRNFRDGLAQMHFASINLCFLSLISFHHVLLPD